MGRLSRVQDDTWQQFLKGQMELDRDWRSGGRGVVPSTALGPALQDVEPLYLSKAQLPPPCLDLPRSCWVRISVVNSRATSLGTTSRLRGRKRPGWAGKLKDYVAEKEQKVLGSGLS